MMCRAILALAVAAVIAWAQEAPIRREGAYWVQVITGSMSLPDDCSLSVRTRGPILLQGKSSSPNRLSYTIKKQVRARSEAEARALLRAARVQTRVRRGVASVSLTGNRPRISASTVLTGTRDLSDVELTTSAGDIEVYDIAGAVEVETGGGLIRMDRIGGDVVARTGGGEIRLGSMDGSLSARTSGGRIEVDQANGIVLADNSGGSIQVGSAAGGVRVASAGGSIRLRGNSGSLRAATDVGSILAELLQGVGIQDSILSTGAGDITVYIPSNLALTVRALNENGQAGRIVSDFAEIMVGRATAQPAARQAVQAEGALNGGGPVLRLTSTGGTIYLKRQQ